MNSPAPLANAMPEQPEIRLAKKTPRWGSPLRCAAIWSHERLGLASRSPNPVTSGPGGFQLGDEDVNATPCNHSPLSGTLNAGQCLHLPHACRPRDAWGSTGAISAYGSAIPAKAHHRWLKELSEAPRVLGDNSRSHQEVSVAATALLALISGTSEPSVHLLVPVAPHHGESSRVLLPEKAHLWLKQGNVSCT